MDRSSTSPPNVVPLAGANDVKGKGQGAFRRPTREEAMDAVRTLMAWGGSPAWAAAAMILSSTSVMLRA